MISGMLGRQAQMDALDGVLAQAAAGCSPVWCTVRGEAGIGKTTLVDEFADLARRRGWRVLRTGLSDVETHLTWAGLRLLLADVHPDANAWAAVDPRCRPSLRAAAGVEQGDADPVLVGSGLVALLVAMAGDRPLVLVIDDLHWLDDATAGALAVVAEQAAGVPLVVVRAVRPVELAGAVGRAAAVDGPLLDLPGLSVAGVRRLVIERTRARIDRTAAVKIHAATGGHPLHALEIGRLIADGRSLDDALTDPSAYEIIADRFRRLDPPVQRVLALAALSPRATVQRLSGALPDEDVAAAVERGRAAHFVRRAEPYVDFAHPLMAAAAVALVSPAERLALHRALAESAVDDDEALHHRIQAADGPDAALAATIDDAAAAAADRNDSVRALELALAALELTPSQATADRVERLLTAADCAIDSGDSVLPLRLAEQAAALDPSPDVVFRSGVTTFIVLGNSGRDAEAAALSEQLLERLGEQPTMCARIHDLRAQLAVSHDHASAVASAKAALAMALRGGDDTQIGRERALVAMTSVLAGEPVDVEQIPASMAALPEMSIEKDWLCEALVFGLPGEVSFEFTSVRLQATVDAGLPLFESPARQAHAISLIAVGRYREALEQVDQWLELQQLIGTTRTAGTTADKAFVHAVIGERAVALDALRVAMTGDLAPVDAMDVFSRACEVHVLLGDPTAAADAAVAARAAVRQVRCGSLRPCSFRPDGVLALAECGRLAEARALLDELAALVAHGRHPLGAADLARASAGLSAVEGRLDDAITEWTTAVAAYEDVGHPLEAARSMLGLGSALRRAGRRREAGEWLRRAADEFDRLGAVLLAGTTRAEADRLGDRRRTGGSELTPTEEQVADLVAGGRSNGDIAAALGVSAKTVESHLTRIYRKLGARSRTELAAIRASSVNRS